MNWFPIHTHVLPDGLRDVPLYNVVRVLEDRPTHLAAARKFKKQLPLNALLAIELDMDLSLSDLRSLMTQGLVAMQVHHWSPNKYLQANGLTTEGHELLAFADDQGLIIDMSHLQGDMLSAVLDAHDGRRIISHVVAKRLLEGDNRSNALTDAELTICRPELIGVPFIDDLLSPTQAWKPEDRTATIDTIVDQIEALSAFGPVALAPDFCQPMGFDVEIAFVIDDDTGLEQLAHKLDARGIDHEDVFWRNADKVF